MNNLKNSILNKPKLYQILQTNSRVKSHIFCKENNDDFVIDRFKNVVDYDFEIVKEFERLTIYINTPTEHENLM